MIHLGFIVDIYKFIQYFDLDLNELVKGESFRGCCPCHIGDNPSSFSMIKCGSTFKWKCFSHHCHEIYGNDLIGLIRGIKKCPFSYAKYLHEKLLNVDYKFLKKDEKKSATPQPIRLVLPKKQYFFGNRFIERSIGNVNLTDYFLENNIPKSIIKKFNLGYDKKSRRIIIPIYDHHSSLVGYDGRISNNKLIGKVDVHGNIVAKFKISYGLKKGHLLYNLNNIKNTKNKYVFLVEGYKDVWALSNMGFDAVSIFGNSIYPEQLYLLKELNRKVFVCLDNDYSKLQETGFNPGYEGSLKILNFLTQANIPAENIIFPYQDKDVGDSFIDRDVKKWVMNKFGNLVQNLEFNCGKKRN